MSEIFMKEPIKERSFSFERKLSLDGVAIITGVILVLIYFGALQEKINQLQLTSALQSVQLNEVGKSIDGVKSDVAVLSAVVGERTGKPLK